MKTFTKLLNLIDLILKRVLQALMILVTIVVVWQVFSRYVLNSPSSFTEELARFLLIWITLLGCAYAYRNNNHLGLDLIYAQARQPYRRIMYYCTHLCVGFFAVSVMIIGGYSLMNMTDKLGQSSPAMGIEISLVYSIVPISGILIVLYVLHAIFLQSSSQQTQERERV